MTGIFSLLGDTPLRVPKHLGLMQHDEFHETVTRLGLNRFKRLRNTEQQRLQKAC